MQNSDKHIKEILEYLGNKMSERDRYAFERKMEADPFLMDAVEGYEEMGMEQVQEELGILQDKLKRKSERKLVPVWLRAAASIVLIVGIGSLWFLNNNAKQSQLVSDHIEVSEKDSPPVEEIPQEVIAVVPDMVEGNTSSEIVEEFVQELEEPRVVRLKPVEKKRSTKKAVIKKDKQGQDVNMALRYEDDAVKAEREFVGQMDGVDFAEVEGSGEVEDLMVQARVTSSKDTLLASYRGRVVDEAGIPLPGVSIKNAMKENGDLTGYVNSATLTDTEGNFEIKAPEKGTVLELSSIGFKDQLALAKQDSIGELVMESENLAMDEVVAIGYGTTKRKSYLKKAKSSEFTYQEAIPEGGMKKFVRSLEKELFYPSEGKRIVIVEVFVLASGELEKVLCLDEDLDKVFKQSLILKFTQAKWQAPQVNGAPVVSYSKIEFEFTGSK
ncbi:carboxypeptidase-like regulatory domain-containing protein [Labilibacter marinus]|uniref:carboxypeptidase-like regulatory domain-containing protein n=1 Tax=Labilibacter marinus TaxID=1477105 RepID=UPI0008376A69|nr:carboxypeptidase-like regulatory domain-containing protein [Labilibacter marinus]